MQEFRCALEFHRTVEEQRRAGVTAFLMGQHTNFGKTSPVLKLPPDVAIHIAKLGLFTAPFKNSCAADRSDVPGAESRLT